VTLNLPEQCKNDANLYAGVDDKESVVAADQYIEKGKLMLQGILKQWSRTWGIIYSPGQKRYFLHKSKIKSGTPDIGVFVIFDAAPARSATELPQAINVIIGDPVPSDVRATAVR
jgi:hypothetical protein